MQKKLQKSVKKKGSWILYVAIVLFILVLGYFGYRGITGNAVLKEQDSKTFYGSDILNSTNPNYNINFPSAVYLTGLRVNWSDFGNGCSARVQYRNANGAWTDATSFVAVPDKFQATSKEMTGFWSINKESSAFKLKVDANCKKVTIKNSVIWFNYTSNSCFSYTYSAWAPNPCVYGTTQTRTVVSKVFGSVCSSPVLSQACPTSCSPGSCVGKCGTITNGNCGGTLNCGGCSAGQVCTNNVCVGSCAPTTCFAQGKNCGTISNGCNGTLNCGSCSASQTCTNNICVTNNPPTNITNSTCPKSANGLDYYVSSLNVNANDANSGTDCTKPWKTFDKIKSSWGSLPAGATVHLERGSEWTWSGYDGWVITSGGTSSGIKAIRGDDYGDLAKSKPIYKRVGTDTHGTAAIQIKNSNYITLRDFLIDGGHKDRDNLHTLGIVVYASTSGVTVTNISILNMRIQNLGGARVYYTDAGQQNQDKYICGIWINGEEGSAISNSLIEGNEVSDYNANGLNHYAKSLLTNNVWRNNYVHNDYPESLRWDATAAIQITSGGYGNVFEYNYLEDKTSTGQGNIHMFNKYSNGDSGSTVVRYNTIVNSRKHGILVYSRNDAGTGQRMLKDIYGNIIVGSNEAGIMVDSRDMWGANSVVNIYNNILVNNKLADWIPAELYISAQNSGVSINIKNNIFNSNVNKALIDIRGGNVITSNNLYWNTNGNTQNAVNNKGTYYSVANVKNFEPTAQNTNPNFVNANSVPSGFKVNSGSPAINTGANLGIAFAKAFDGVSRSGSWDIGVYEQ